MLLQSPSFLPRRQLIVRHQLRSRQGLVVFFSADKTISAGRSQVCLQRYATCGNSPLSPRRQAFWCCLTVCLNLSVTQGLSLLCVSMVLVGKWGVDEVMHGVLQHVELFLACWKTVELLPPDLTECQSKHGFLIWSHHSSDPGLFFPNVESPAELRSAENNVVISPADGRAHQGLRVDGSHCLSAACPEWLHHGVGALTSWII